MNVINLLEILKTQIDVSTFQKIESDFMESFRQEYKKLRPCKSTAEKAQKKYISNAKMKDQENRGAYTNGYTVLMLSADIPEAEPEKIGKIDLATKVCDMWKNRRPADCYFMDSIALYKALKKQENRRYFLHMDGHYYDAALISEMLDCIATAKERHITAEICENGALMIRQQTAAALILPVYKNAHHPAENINMQEFLKYCNKLEETLPYQVTANIA